jgi:hypothetical protein
MISGLNYDFVYQAVNLNGYSDLSDDISIPIADIPS